MKCKLIAVAGYMALAFSSTADAEPVYSVNIGLDYSNVDTQFGFGGVANPPATTIGDDYSAVGGRIGFGVAFSDLAAFEMVWVRLGTDSTTADMIIACPGSCPPDTPPNIEEVKHRGTAFSLAYTPTLRRDDWSVLGKVGIARVTNETKGVDSPGARVQRTRNEPLIGAGLVYYFRDNLGLRFDLDWMGGKATTFGVGISYRF